MEAAEIFSFVIAGATVAYVILIMAFSVPLFRRTRRGKPVTGNIAFVSVIVPVRNEALNIPACLESIAGQDYPPDRFEILITDDFSGDKTAEIAEQFFRQHPAVRGRVIASPEGSSPTGKKAALWRAIQASSGDWILATDADTVRGPGWISAMIKESQAAGRKMVLGPVAMSAGQGWFGRIQSLEFMGIMAVTAGSAKAGIPVMCNGANLLYRKQAFEDTGGFAAHAGYASGDDQFLLSSVRRQYGEHSVGFALDREAVVITTPQDGLLSFLQQRLRWVSKSKGYRDPAVLLTGGLTYLVHLALLAGLIAGSVSDLVLKVALLCWILKMTADLLPVAIMSGFFQKKKLLWLFLPAQVFQMVYVVFTGILGLVLPYRWKGRLIRA
jgi:poly-beta-1,6-N-acetyl-D-glucosamine synthase